MEKIKIKLSDAFLLDAEINGMKNIDPNTKEEILIVKGLLNESIDLATKYWLLDLNNQIQEIITTIEQLKVELVKKYGEIDINGNMLINYFLKENEINPNYELFQYEFNKLLLEEKELTYKPILLSSIENIKTEWPYTFILQHLVNPN
jgi:hypothetical protein